jgi:peptidylprolyl isomerase
MAKRAENGDTIVIHYTGWKLSGEVFDTTKGKEPLGFSLGKGEVIPGLDREILGMELGENKKIRVPKELAYGEKIPNLVANVPRDQFLGKIVPEVGKVLAVKSPYGGIMPARIVDLTETHVIVDMNKPLAGEDLIFEITVVDIIKKQGIQ